jgi:peptide/nickel transport system ATP-binding protein
VFCDRVAVMDPGRIVEVGPVEDVLGQPRQAYAQALQASILEPDPAKRLPEISLDATFPNPLDPPSGCAFHPRWLRTTDLCSTDEPEARGLPGSFIACHPAHTRPHSSATLNLLPLRRPFNA